MTAVILTTSAMLVLWLIVLPAFDEVTCLAGFRSPRRLLAVGDLHGDIVNAKEVLRFAQVVDCDGHWNADMDTVVQMGDVLDRGPHGHEIIEFFSELRAEAKAAGGEFIQLIGNHELMNMQGDVKFVNPAMVKVFGGMDRLKSAFDPQSGAYGNPILKGCEAVVVRNRTLFVHAGIVPQFAEYGAERLNWIVKQALLSKNFSDPVLGAEGPLWTRQIIYPALQGNCSNLRESLRRLSAHEEQRGRPALDRMVVGHTIMQDGAIHVLCDGQLIAVDIAISEHMQGGGKLGILELRYDYAKHSDHVMPYIQYPSQPWRSHAFPVVQYPKWIPLPPFQIPPKESKGVQGAALTIRVAADDVGLTNGEMVILIVALCVFAVAVVLQSRDRNRWLIKWLGPLKGRKDKLDDAA